MSKCKEFERMIEELKSLRTKEDRWYSENDEDALDTDIVDTQIAIRELEEKIREFVRENEDELIEECGVIKIREWIE